MTERKPTTEEARERIAERARDRKVANADKIVEKSLLDGVTFNEIPGTDKEDDYKAPTYRKGMLVDPLVKFYSGMGMMLMPLDQHCASVILQQAEPMARSLDDLARTNPAVRKALLKLVQGSAWSMVIAAHLPLIMSVSIHHVPAIRDRMAEFGLAEAQAFVDSQGDADK